MISAQPRAAESYNIKPDTRRSQGSWNERPFESDSGDLGFPRKGWKRKREREREREFHRIKKIQFSLVAARIVPRAPWRSLPLAETLWSVELEQKLETSLFGQLRTTQVAAFPRFCSRAIHCRRRIRRAVSPRPARLEYLASRMDTEPVYRIAWTFVNTVA